MEKINLFGNRFILNPSQQHGSAKKKKSVERKKFANIVDSVSEKNDSADEEFGGRNQRDLDELLEEIKKAGARLKESPTMQAVKSYKQIISGFLKNVSQNMLQVDEKISGFGIKKRKRFTLIKLVDKKLEELTIEILSQQITQLKILEKVDEINGMVIDLIR